MGCSLEKKAQDLREMQLECGVEVKPDDVMCNVSLETVEEFGLGLSRMKRRDNYKLRIIFIGMM